jgi:hypothetical protein
MAIPARAAVEVRDFFGLQDHTSSDDLPPGAAEAQVNATCVKPGELQVRLGMREVTFDSEA